MDGTAFGRYRLVELLGRGGMGEVWRAYDTAANDRTVAIKLLPPHLAGDTMFIARFRREAEAAAQLNNPHIIPIHNYGEIDGRLYVDMRLVEGRDLQAVLGDGPMQPSRAVRVIDQVAKALQAAHEIGRVHRDVKPSNVLLDRDDFAYLIDFGLTRAVDDASLTDTGFAPGTLRYMAPERLSENPGEEDARVDIYALACTLYECLTGQPPFTGTDHASLVAAHLNSPPPKPTTSQPDVPAELDAVIAKGMAKDPDDRYATTVELAHAAGAAIGASMPQSATVPRPLRRRASPRGSRGRRLGRRTRIALVAGGIAVAAVVAVVLGVVLAGGSSSPPVASQPAPKPATSEVVLPFTGLNSPGGVAVDGSGAVVVADSGNNRIVRLAAGSSSQEVLPFSGLSGPEGVAVDASGAVVVADTGNSRVVRLAAGSSSQEELVFSGLNHPGGVAVDGSGAVVVADSGNNRIVRLAAGSSNQVTLPFSVLNSPEGLAVDGSGAVVVADWRNGRVVRLAAGSSNQEVLPFPGLSGPEGVAVDGSGGVVVTDWDKHRVVRLAVGSSTEQVLPFSDLRYPEGVAVDGSGAVYVPDAGNRVLKLPPQ